MVPSDEDDFGLYRCGGLEEGDGIKRMNNGTGGQMFGLCWVVSDEQGRGPLIHPRPAWYHSLFTQKCFFIACRELIILSVMDNK